MIEQHQVRNVMVMRRALYQHNKNCPMPAASFRMNPHDFERLGISMIWGVPVIPDSSVEVKRVRLECEGSAHGIEQILGEWESGLPQD